MAPFRHGTGPVIDHQIIAPAARITEIKLIDGRDAFRRLGIKLSRELGQDVSDSLRHDGSALYARPAALSSTMLSRLR